MGRAPAPIRHRGAPRRVTGLLVLLSLVPGLAVAGQEEVSGGVSPVFATLEGHWIGSGVLLGQPAEFTMHWEIGTDGFVRLRFTNAWVGSEGTSTPVLSSAATYLPSGSSALGVWLDDRPQRLTLHATVTDSTVTTNWTADAEEGRTEYVVRSPREVYVRDVVYVDGSERLFAEAIYRPAPTPPG